jgi:hypothetical protein
MIVYRGKLYAFAETGTEGTVWMLMQPGDYYPSISLRQGDHLTVFDDDNNVIWEGEVKCDFKKNYQPYPSNPTMGQPVVFGFWVHWLHPDVDAEVWASWFFDGHTAELKREK